MGKQHNRVAVFGDDMEALPTEERFAERAEDLNDNEVIRTAYLGLSKDTV